MGKSRQRHRRAAEARLHPPAAADEHYWPALTGLRGLAALGVLLFSVFTLADSPDTVPAPVAWLSAIGWSGVDLFFTLSAFLLTVPLVRARDAGSPPPSLREYWRHRAWRILPAYYVQLAIVLLLALAGAAAASSWREPGLRSLAANAFFLYDIVPGISPAVPTWWTLPVQLGFYLLLPLLARLLTAKRWPWLLAAIVASLAWRWWLLHSGFERPVIAAWAEHLPGRLHQFVVGMLAAWLFVRRRALFAAWSSGQRDLVLALAMLAYLALPALALPSTGRPYNAAVVADPWLFGWHLYASLLAALVMVVLASAPSRIGRLLSAGWVGALGVISYSLYLWHYPVLLGLREGLGGDLAVKSGFGAFLFCGLLFSVLVAGASWWLVERPALRFARRDKMPASPARAHP